MNKIRSLVLGRVFYCLKPKFVVKFDQENRRRAGAWLNGRDWRSRIPLRVSEVRILSPPQLKTMMDTFLNLNAGMGISSSLILLIFLWVLPWKGVALWKSAKNGHKKWFIALFLLNTLAILEIIYIFYFSKPKHADQSNR